jgi:hypothetical protein
MIESYTGFQPLKEVWLGDVYPVEWYENYNNRTRDFFSEITEITKLDLNKIEKKLIELGILVRRPKFDNKAQFLDEHDNLCKPPITPRDWAMTLGNTLYVIPQYPNSITGFDSAIAEYKNNNQNAIVLDRSLPDPECYVSFPSTVRIGADLYLDCHPENSNYYKNFLTAANNWAKDYRVHITHTGDHSDGVFCPVTPGQIFSTHYRTQYKKTFPNWEVFWLTDTTKTRKNNNRNGKWWVNGYNYQHFNDSVSEVAENWIGNPSETVFEVNMLIIDEKNVLCIAEDDAGFKKLEQLGITPHVVDFRTRGFWDGGLHCLTVDIHRTGGKLDYWPGRGNFGIQYYGSY